MLQFYLKQETLSVWKHSSLSLVCAPTLNFCSIFFILILSNAPSFSGQLLTLFHCVGVYIQQALLLLGSGV